MKHNSMENEMLIQQLQCEVTRLGVELMKYQKIVKFLLKTKEPSKIQIENAGKKLNGLSWKQYCKEYKNHQHNEVPEEVK